MNRRPIRNGFKVGNRGTGWSYNKKKQSSQRWNISWHSPCIAPLEIPRLSASHRMKPKKLGSGWFWVRPIAGDKEATPANRNEFSLYSSELKFLKKMPNPGILKSWIWGETEFEDILFLPKQFSKTSLHQPGELYLFNLNSLDASNPSWQVIGPGSILNNTANLKFKLIKFIENQVMTTASGQIWRS